MARKTWAEAQITRQRILDAAADVFFESGFSSASLQKVADAAGLTRGAIYWHFVSKQHLLDALMSRSPNLGRNKRPGALANDESLRVVEQLALEPLERLCRSEQLKCTLGISPHSDRPADSFVSPGEGSDERRTAYLLRLQLACEELVRRGELADELSGKNAATGLTRIVEGLMLRWIQDPSAFDLLGAGRLAVSAYLKGAGARSAIWAHQALS